MTKKELRAAMRRRNLGMDAAERAEASRRIFGRAGRLEAFGAARTVFSARFPTSRTRRRRWRGGAP